MRPPFRMNPIVAFWLGIVAMVALGTVAVRLPWQGWALPPLGQLRTVESTQQPSPTHPAGVPTGILPGQLVAPSSETRPAMATWRQYENPDFRFKFRYPARYVLRDKHPVLEPFSVELDIVPEEYSALTIHNPEIRLKIMRTTLDPESWLDRNGTTSSIFEQPGNYLLYGVKERTGIRIGRLEALRFSESGTSFAGTHTIFKSGDLLFDIASYATGVGEIPTQDYDDMLETLQLLD